MEIPRGILGRLLDKIMTAVVALSVVGIGIALWQMGPDARATLWAGIWKTLAWVVFAAAAPWSSALIMRRLLSLGSNWAGVGLLAALILTDVLAGLWLLGGMPTGFWPWAVCLTALAAACAYNYLVSEYLAERSIG
jgi:hypothetical protein